MADESPSHHHPFSVINRNSANTSWDGSPITLLPNQSIHAAATPLGSTVLAFQNESTQNTPATLALTAGGNAPIFLTVPALTAQPSILVKNWNGNNLGITNVTPPDIQVPVFVELIAPGLPWLIPSGLPTDGTAVPLGSGQAAQGTTQPRWMQAILQAGSNHPIVFAIIGGPPDKSGNNVYVIALNAAHESGPGTNNPPPAGYYATTVGALYTYQLNWGVASIFAANMSAADVGQGSVSLRGL